ncbi:hypothetical protein [Streptomyces sp. NPDC094472]|uniref:hypothetical protein n=1 Tax=Streptomyces sp. NPDC094472 TaxID=3155080 RepID=UPI003319019A
MDAAEHDVDSRVLEDGIEQFGELPVSVPDHEPCPAAEDGNLPRTPSDAVPETPLFAAEVRDHLDRLAEALALDAPPRTGDLRAAFDRVATDGRLAQLTDPTVPGGISHARSRALTA